MPPASNDVEPPKSTEAPCLTDAYVLVESDMSDADQDWLSPPPS